MVDKDKADLAENQVLKPVNEDEIKEFKQIMEEYVIPKIVKTVEKRRSAAAKSRLKQLKC